MILLTHPTGNVFVRALLMGLLERDQLDSFNTTLNMGPFLPFTVQPLRDQLSRRSFPAPFSKVHARPCRELIRLVAPRLGMSSLTAHEIGWASLDQVIYDLDRVVASDLRKRSMRECRSLPSGVYSYEDCCLSQFEIAKDFGLPCFYELPIAYWETSRRLLAEEAERWPEWESTLVAPADSAMKLERKTQEVELADVVVCPSSFVLESLPLRIRKHKKCVVAEFGSPDIPDNRRSDRPPDDGRPLRVLFAGSMTQRKGLADVFAAMKLIKRRDIQLIVMGAPLVDMSFYRQQYPEFTYERPRPHNQVLSLMDSCDLLVLPSIVEGRALVQQEAMACGLPIIVTANAGGADLVDEGETGFLVDIRSPDKIAEKLHWFADHRSLIPEMSRQARKKALEVTWNSYREKICAAIFSQP